MEKFFLVLNWIVGSFLLLVGFASIVTDGVIGLPFILMGLLFFPPFRKLMFNLTGKKLNAVYRGILAFIFFMPFVYIIDHRKNQGIAEEEAKKVAEFEAKKTSIVDKAHGLYNQELYPQVISFADKYDYANNQELIDLKAKAENKIKVLKVFADLKLHGEDSYQERARLYSKLVELDPNNDTYNKKLAEYSKLAKEKHDKLERKRIRDEKIEKSFSPWSGAHNGLERLIKKGMNDPDSYDHVKTIYYDRGETLLVKTTFRGTNAFGAKVIGSVTAEVDLDGNVIKVVEQ